MNGFLHVDTFKQKYKITQERLNELEREMIVEIVQTGYRGHSLAHPRAVVFNPKTIERVLNRDSFPELAWRYRCLNQAGSLFCLREFQTKADLDSHRETARHFFAKWEATVEAQATIKKMKKLAKLSAERRKHGHGKSKRKLEST